MGCACSNAKDGPVLEERFKGARRLSQLAIHAGYFCETASFKKLISKFPQLMLLPWEYQRAMGVVKLADPMALKYTFLSHQWETLTHPFPDLKQVTEHLNSLQDPYFWADWYCVPQWSRNADPYPADPVATTIFLMTMKSFHRLCAFSASALAVVKRGVGLKMRGFDMEAGWQIDDEMLSDAAEAETSIEQGREKSAAKSTPLLLKSLTEELACTGVDLEYGVRAWCALERCYLPAAPHKDVRLLSLVASLKKAQSHARLIQSETLKQQNKDKSPGNNGSGDDHDPLSKYVNNLERLSGLMHLCQPSESNRAFYMNAWAYNYLKRCVLTITHLADYLYLDALMVTGTDMGQHGSLYLQSVADDEAPLKAALEALNGARPEGLLEPRVHFPDGSTPGILTLDCLFGVEAREELDKTAIKTGETRQLFGGVRLMRVQRFELDKKRAFLWLSDSGLLGSSPSVTELELRWQGGRTNMTAIVVKTRSRRLWTREDRLEFRRQKEALALAALLSQSGLAT